MLPNGAHISTYGNVEQRDGFKLPPPYKLSGETPDPLHTDVKAIHDVALRRNLHPQMLPGLVMRLEALTVQQYITFDNVNGEHRFHEASGDQRLFMADGLKDYLAYLETLGHEYSPPPKQPIFHFQPEGHTG